MTKYPSTVLGAICGRIIGLMIEKVGRMRTGMPAIKRGIKVSDGVYKKLKKLAEELGEKKRRRVMMRRRSRSY